MGSPFTIVFYCGDSLQANAIAVQCFHLVDSFNMVFSDYNDGSELSKLNASSGKNHQPVQVSPALFQLLMLSKKAFDKSDGAFDITIGPIVKLWRQARKTKQFPLKDTVQSKLNQTGFRNMVMDSFHRTVRLMKPGMQLDVGGIAKGWIAQKIIDFLHNQQVGHALVNAGGDIAMSAAPPGTRGWTIGVNIPETTDELLSQNLLLQNKAVATSGDAYQYMVEKGKKYSHIIDPHTGYGVTTMRNVTVIAGDGATADWLATACSILKIKKAKRLAVQMGADVLIATMRKGHVILNATKGFNRYWKPVVQ